MKSILQEASTIAKAIEQAWKEAGEPQQFSVKILELPQRNFIGITTRSAKIALMFAEIPKVTEVQSARQTVSHTHKKQHQVREKVQNRPIEPKVVERIERQASMQEPPVQKREPIQKEQKESRKKLEGLWNDEIIKFAQDWFAKIVQYMGYTDVTFTIEQQHFYLRITLNKPILSDASQEKYLLASLSLLALSTIKKHFRKALRGHKIVITHAKSE